MTPDEQRRKIIMALNQFRRKLDILEANLDKTVRALLANPTVTPRKRHVRQDHVRLVTNEEGK